MAKGLLMHQMVVFDAHSRVFDVHLSRMAIWHVDLPRVMILDVDLSREMIWDVDLSRVVICYVDLDEVDENNWLMGTVDLRGVVHGVVPYDMYVGVVRENCVKGVRYDYVYHLLVKYNYHCCVPLTDICGCFAIDGGVSLKVLGRVSLNVLVGGFVIGVWKDDELPGFAFADFDGNLSGRVVVDDGVIVNVLECSSLNVVDCVSAVDHE